MIKLCDTVDYVNVKTLTGNKLIVGDRGSNSYVMIKPSERNVFYKFLEEIKTKNISTINDLSADCRNIAEGLKKRGYLNDVTESNKSFNEYEALGRKLFEKDISPENAVENTNIFRNILYFALFALIAILDVMFMKRTDLVIDIHAPSVLEWVLISVTCFPLVIGLHEAGHYLLSRITGIPPSKLIIGFFVIYPTVYISYSGINLSRTINRISIISGGVFAHLLSAFAGMMLLREFGDSTFLKVFVLGNISMVTANLLPLGASDGYFLITSLLGIYDLRLKGYKAINSWMHFKKNDFSVNIFGIIVLALWVLSFWGLHQTMDMLGGNIGIAMHITNIIFIASATFMFLRFLIKVYRMKFKV